MTCHKVETIRVEDQIYSYLVYFGEAMGEVMPCQEVKPLRVVMPSQEVKPLRVVMPCQEVKPLRVVMPCQEVKPLRVVMPCQEVKPLKVVMPCQEVKPLRVVVEILLTSLVLQMHVLHTKMSHSHVVTLRGVWLFMVVED